MKRNNKNNNINNTKRLDNLLDLVIKVNIIMRADMIPLVQIGLRVLTC